VAVDVRDETQIEELVARTESQFGRIDYLINNAGAIFWQTVLETPPRRFDLVMNVNLRGAFLACRAVLPLMMRQRFGHIINMSPPWDARWAPGRVAYAISKLGMTLLTLGLAEEVKASNIAVNSLGPATMIDEVEAALVAAGVPAAHVHVERFGTPGASAAVTLPPAADAAEAHIGLIVDGVRREVEFHREHGSILEAGLAAGLDLPYSCKAGMCCTCRARKLEGEVKMRNNYALEQADLAAGHVLACQSYPLSARVVLSFDER
jgi:ferredoxin